MNRLQALKEAKGAWDNFFLKNIPLPGAGLGKAFEHPYESLELVYICISTTARAISQVPLVVTERGSDGTRLPVPDKNPWQQLINRPNMALDRYSFIESLVGYILLDGEVFLVPFPPQKEYGKNPPASLWAVRKKQMKAVKSKNGQLEAWEYRPQSGGDNNQGPVFKFSPWEVPHPHLWNPADPYSGLSPVQAGRLSLETDFLAQQYNKLFFDEGAIPGGIVATDQKLTERTLARLRKQFEERHKGVNNAHKMAVLEQGLKYSQTGLSHKDMEYLNLRKYERQTILQIFGMKEAVISITADTNYSTAKEQTKQWWLSTNTALMKLITSALQLTLLRGTPYGVMFDTSNVEALQESYQEKVAVAEKLWKMGFTANEVNDRLQLGFGKRGWRDFWYLPINMTPVAEDGSMPLLDDAQNQQVPNQLGVPSNGGKAELEGSSRTKPARALPPSKKDFEDVWKEIELGAAPLEEEFSRKISLVMYRMRTLCLKLLERDSTGRLLKEEGFLKAGTDIRKISSDFHENALFFGIQSIRKDTRSQIDWNDPMVIDYLTGKNLQVLGMVGTIKKQVIQEIDEATSLGENQEALANRVRRVFNAASSRTGTISRTEIWGSINFGRYWAIDRVGGERIWLSADDENVRSSHFAMLGKKAGPGEKWVLPSGTSLRFPGDWEGPANEIINCRCVELLVK